MWGHIGISNAAPRDLNTVGLRMAKELINYEQGWSSRYDSRRLPTKQDLDSDAKRITGDFPHDHWVGSSLSSLCNDAEGSSFSRLTSLSHFHPPVGVRVQSLKSTICRRTAGIGSGVAPSGPAD